MLLLLAVVAKLIDRRPQELVSEYIERRRSSLIALFIKNLLLMGGPARTTMMLGPVWPSPSIRMENFLPRHE